MASLRKLDTIALVQVPLALATIAACDAIAYFSLSDETAYNFPTYREGYYVPDFFGRGYPRGYYAKNAERGFDIAPTEVARKDQFHELDDVDVPHPSPSANFAYFAGIG